MSTPTIMVQMAEPKWTAAALELACQQAASTGAEVALVELLHADAIHWLCCEADEYVFSESEREDLNHYREIAARHQVPMSVRVMKYDTLEQGIVEAADRVNADTVFVTLPPSVLSFLHNRQVKHLSHLLEEHNHHLITFRQPEVTEGWKPEVEILS